MSEPVQVTDPATLAAMQEAIKRGRESFSTADVERHRKRIEREAARVVEKES